MVWNVFCYRKVFSASASLAGKTAEDVRRDMWSNEPITADGQKLDRDCQDIVHFLTS
jgi:hypothetical protein